MTDFTLVIVSGSSGNLVKCLKRVQELNPLSPEQTHVIIDEGKGRAYMHALVGHGFRCTVHEAPPPFNYSRFVNLGIAARTTPNVILMEDDSLLMTPLGLDKLNWLAETFTNVGACSAEIWGTVCNPKLKPQSKWTIPFRSIPDMVTTMCLALPERTLKELSGPFEERITFYGKDDWDFSKRVLNAGLHLAVSPLCCVEHDQTLKSFWRAKPDLQAQITASHQQYMDIWGEAPRLKQEEVTK